jgi:hypothetical protein
MPQRAQHERFLRCILVHPVRPEVVEACPEPVEGGERRLTQWPI